MLIAKVSIFIPATRLPNTCDDTFLPMKQISPHMQTSRHVEINTPPIPSSYKHQARHHPHPESLPIYPRNAPSKLIYDSSTTFNPTIAPPTLFFVVRKHSRAQSLLPPPLPAPNHGYRTNKFILAHHQHARLAQ